MNKEILGKSLREFIRKPVRAVKENPGDAMAMGWMAGFGALSFSSGVYLIAFRGDYYFGPALVVPGILSIPGLMIADGLRREVKEIRASRPPQSKK